MKVSLIGMILNNAGRACFDGFVIDDNGKHLPAAESLHTLMMEYAKVMNGGTSDLVVASREVLVASPLMRQCGVTGDSKALASAARDLEPMGRTTSGAIGMP